MSELDSSLRLRRALDVRTCTQPPADFGPVHVRICTQPYRALSGVLATHHPLTAHCGVNDCRLVVCGIIYATAYL
jgi:hypothetical protein